MYSFYYSPTKITQQTNSHEVSFLQLSRYEFLRRIFEAERSFLPEEGLGIYRREILTRFETTPVGIFSFLFVKRKFWSKETSTSIGVIIFFSLFFFCSRGCLLSNKCNSSSVGLLIVLVTYETGWRIFDTVVNTFWITVLGRCRFSWLTKSVDRSTEFLPTSIIAISKANLKTLDRLNILMENRTENVSLPLRSVPATLTCWKPLSMSICSTEWERKIFFLHYKDQREKTRQGIEACLRIASSKQRSSDRSSDCRYDN